MARGRGRRGIFFCWVFGGHFPEQNGKVAGTVRDVCKAASCRSRRTVPSMARFPWLPHILLRKMSAENNAKKYASPPPPSRQASSLPLHNIGGTGINVCKCHGRRKPKGMEGQRGRERSCRGAVFCCCVQSVISLMKWAIIREKLPRRVMSLS